MSSTGPEERLNHQSLSFSNSALIKCHYNHHVVMHCIVIWSGIPYRARAAYLLLVRMPSPHPRGQFVSGRRTLVQAKTSTFVFPLVSVRM